MNELLKPTPENLCDAIQERAGSTFDPENVGLGFERQADTVNYLKILSERGGIKCVRLHNPRIMSVDHPRISEVCQSCILNK